MIAGVAAWNLVQYFVSGVAASHYLRSVSISTMVGVCVQMSVLRANAVLNNYATGDPKFCHSLPRPLITAMGCERLSPRAERRLYWGIIAGLNLFMIVNWIWGQQLRRVLLGH